MRLIRNQYECNQRMIMRGLYIYINRRDTLNSRIIINTECINYKIKYDESIIASHCPASHIKGGHEEPMR